MSGDDAIARLMAPRSVAVVGASTDPTKTAGRPVGYLLKHGFKGGIWPVNPRVKEISGLACFPDIASLPDAPDVAIVLLGPERAQAAVAELAARGAGAAIVLAGGYGEIGPDGAQRQRELKSAAGPMRLLGPNTIGIVNLVDKVVLSPSGALEIDELAAGAVSVVSQSGGILGALLSRGADRGLGFARLISTGNEADLDTADFVAHLAADEATSVIALYLEGVRRPDAFRRAADMAAARGKHIVAYKVGRSAEGARSAVSHTGALAGSDRIYDAFFRQTGVIRAATFADLLDIPAGLVAGRRPAGRRVAILTSTGGAGTLVADALGLAGFAVPDPDRATAERLAALVDDDQAAAHRNPVDVTLAGLKPEVLRQSIAALLDSPGYDAVVVVVGSSALAQPRLAADAMAACLDRSGKPLFAFVSPHAPHIVALLNGRGIPAFAAPESLAAALAALAGEPAKGARERRAASGGAAAASSAAPDAGTSILDEAASKALFARHGIPCAVERVAATPVEAEVAAHAIGGTVVLKILSRRIAHKSDVGGVRVGVAAADVRQEAEAMWARVRTAGIEPEGFLVQELLRGGVEMILGLERDPQLGPVLLIGAGGTTAELLGDTAIRLLPVTRAEVEAMLASLRSSRLLAGFRGAPPCDLPALIDAVLAFARMAEHLGEELIEAEINPLIVLPAGHGVRAVDGLAVVGPGLAGTD